MHYIATIQFGTVVYLLHVNLEKQQKKDRKTYHFQMKTYPIWKAGGEGGCNESLNKKKQPRVVYKFPVPPCSELVN